MENQNKNEVKLDNRNFMISVTFFAICKKLSIVENKKEWTAECKNILNIMNKINPVNDFFRNTKDDIWIAKGTDVVYEGIAILYNSVKHYSDENINNLAYQMVMDGMTEDQIKELIESPMLDSITDEMINSISMKGVDYSTTKHNKK